MEGGKLLEQQVTGGFGNQLCDRERRQRGRQGSGLCNEERRSEERRRKIGGSQIWRDGQTEGEKVNGG